MGGPSPLDVEASPDGLIRVTVTDAGITDKSRKAVEQSIEVIRRRIDAARHKRAEHPAPGRRPRADAGAGPSGPDTLKEIVGKTAKLDIPPRRRSGPRSVGQGRGAADQVETGQARSAVEKQVMVTGEDPDGRAARIRPARSGEPVVNFRFNMRGAPAIRPGDDRERRAAVRHRARQQGHLRAADPDADHRRLRPDHRQFHRRSRPMSSRCCCAPARCRRSSTIVEERTVGPGLGQDSIDAGKRAGLCRRGPRRRLHARRPMACSACSPISRCWCTSLFIFAAIVLLGATLTLPGIAGIVLTIGMAVDSNVLIYERIREEDHAGRSVIAAARGRLHTRLRDHHRLQRDHVRRGGDPLFFFGSGPVRGFAVSLALGILTSHHHRGDR